MLRQPLKISGTAEDLFLAHYAQMREWALHLTGHDEARAEDLAHDAFVQLMLGPPDFASIENIEGYLFTVLRNLYRSQLSRSNNSPAGPAYVVDFDSAEAGLRAADGSARFHAVEELLEVCRYACARKGTSKAGGVLILRFFHGYYPSEIARLLCATPQAVSELLRCARAEARLHLDAPARLGFIGNGSREAGAPVAPAQGAQAETTEDVISGLRRAIFAARTEDCPQERQMRDIYTANRPELVTAPLLAHIVSCQPCLDLINDILSLPPLSDRHPPDMLGPNPHAGGNHTGPRRVAPKAGRSDAAKKSLKRLRRLAQNVYEHTPAELRVAVNGVVVAAHKLGSQELTEQTLRLDSGAGPSFIEVFSEQGVRLLYLLVEAPPAGEFEQESSVSLSDGRRLEASISHCGPWPHLRLRYYAGASGALKITDDESADEADPLRDSLFAAPDAGFDRRRRILAKLKSTLRALHSGISHALRPVTIALLLAIPLLAAVIGYKLTGWFFRPTAPVREARPSKLPNEGGPAAPPGPESSPSKAPAAPAPSITPAAPSVAPVTATVALEIEALRLLHEAGADAGEQIEVKRTQQGGLLIVGLVDDEARKQRIQRALAPIATHEAVKIDLQTFAEAVEKQRRTQSEGTEFDRAAPVTVDSFQPSNNRLPLEDELRRYFTARGVGSDELDRAISRFAADALDSSQRLLLRAGAMRKLARRFTAEQLQQLEDGARAEYMTLLKGHASIAQSEAARLAEMLQQVLLAFDVAPAEQAVIGSDAELIRAIEKLFGLCASNDRAVRAAFTVSHDAAPVAVIKSAPFRAALKTIEQLSREITQFR